MSDVAIIGGGIIGLTSAYFLAKEGASVAVHDRGDLGKEASWAGAGILPPGDPDRAATPADKLRGIGSLRFPEFSSELRELTGIDNGYRRCGGIEFLAAEDAGVTDVWRAEGISFERLTLDDVKKLEPLGDVEGEPHLLPACAQVRNPWHLRALVAGCENRNVELTPNCPVESWKFDRGRVVGLFDSTGRLHGAGAYLVSTGAWAGGCLRSLGCGFGIHPVRGQIVLYSGAERLLSRVIIEGKRYLVPRGDGRILAGSTEEPEAGFAKATTPAGESDLRCFAENWIPALARATVEQSWAGLRPTSADGLPAIGPVPGHPNVFAAVGHGRAGIQLSLGPARLMLQHVTGGELPAYADAFRLDRPPNTDFRSAFRS